MTHKGGRDDKPKFNQWRNVEDWGASSEYPRYVFMKIAADKALSTQKYWYFSYFFMKTYIVVLNTMASPRHF